MHKHDAAEAYPILQRMLRTLLAGVPARGRAGSDVRAAGGALHANAAILVQADQAGPPLAAILDLARQAGINLPTLAHVRDTVVAEPAISLGAVLLRSSIIAFMLATEGHIIANTTFQSRQDVERLKSGTNAIFNQIEEYAADAMDAMTYRGLVKLRAAITFHLIETARPLPRMLNFRFAAPMSTLQMAYKLYDDAGRADELRQENSVVHPAFARPAGQALSA